MTTRPPSMLPFLLSKIQNAQLWQQLQYFQALLPKLQRAPGDIEALQPLKAHDGSGNAAKPVLAQVQVSQTGVAPGQGYPKIPFPSD